MYSSVDDVRNALAPGGSTSDPSTPASIDEGEIVDAISEADGIINGYISSRYTVPSDPVLVAVAVSPVRWWSRNIAAWLLTLTYRKQQDVGPDEPIRLRYDQTIAFLTQVRDGQMDLGSLAANDTATGDQVFVENLYQNKLFPTEPSGGWDRDGWRVTGYVRPRY